MYIFNLYPFGKIIIPIRIEGISVSDYKFVPFDLEVTKHAKQDGFTIVEFAKELPISIANTHKKERNDLPVPKVIMPPPSPIPDVPPQNPV